jgi:hypothetical protein
MHQPVDPCSTDDHPEAELATAMDRSLAALEAAGLSVGDRLAALLEERAALLEEVYGSAYMREIEQQIAG